MPFLGVRQGVPGSYLGGAGGSAPALWTPLNLGSAVVAWWDAGSGIGFGSGSNVNTWTDRANGIVATNGAATFPVFSATSRNGKPGVSFSGGVAKMLFSAASFPSGSAASTVGVSTFQTSNSNNSIAFSWGSATAHAARAFGKGATNLGLYSDGGTNEATTEGFGTTDRFLVSVMPGGTSPTNRLYVNGGLAETAAFSTPVTTTSNGFIGIWPDGSSFNMIGIIQNIYVFNRELTDSELEFLAGFDSWWTGKAGSDLPASSHFKTRPPLASDPAFLLGNRPFLASSAVNQPLSFGVNWQPQLWPLSTGFNYYGAIKNYIDIPNLATAPTCTWFSTAGLGWPARTVSKQMTSGFNGVNYLNTGIFTLDDEAEIIIGTNIMDAYGFARNSDTTALQSGQTPSCDLVTSTGMGISGVSAAGVVAALSSNFAGMAIKEELTKYGKFPHMIAFSGLSVLVNTGVPISPAISNDGQSTSSTFVEGNVLTFPPGTTMPAGLDYIGQALFAAGRDYGFLCVDNGGSTGWNIGLLYNPNGSPSVYPQFAAATSWSASDLSSFITNANILFPLLCKTGLPYDGMANILSMIGTCDPQTQFSGNLASTLMQVTRDSDTTTTNVSTTGTAAGLLNTSTISTFCSGTVGRVTQYNNQSDGSHNFLSAGTAAPIIYQSGALKTINGNPAVLFDGASNYFAQQAGKSTGSTVYFNAVIQLTDLLADYAIFGCGTSGGLVLKINATTGFPELRTNTGTLIGTATASIAAGSAYVISAEFVSGSTWAIWINGQGAGCGTTAVTAPGGVALVGSAGPAGANYFKGLIGAFHILNGIPVNPQYTLEGGLANFWAPLGTFARTTTTIAQDTFTDTNGVLLGAHTMNVGSGWTDLVGNHTIQSNTAQPNAVVSQVALSTFTGVANGTFACTLTPANNPGSNEYDPGLVFRLSDASNFFTVQFEASVNRVSLYSVVAGSATRLAGIPMAITTGTPYTVVIAFYNGYISFSVNGVNAATVVSNVNLYATGAGIRSVYVFDPTKPSYDNLLLTT